MFWYAIHTKPRQESLVEASLGQYGLETFCPRIKQVKLVRRKRVIRVGALFPNYLFVRFHVDKDLRGVKYARGVRNIVSFGSTPSVVSEDLILGLKEKLEADIWDASSTKFASGQPVRIQDGPLYGLEAVFEREMSDHCRAVLLLKALAYQARVIVPLEYVVNL